MIFLKYDEYVHFRLVRKESFGTKNIIRSKN